MKSIAPTALLLLLAPVAMAQTPYLVDDINFTTDASPLSSLPRNFFRFGSRVYFSAQTIPSGTELWSTDGTAAGTAQVADIRPGSGSSSPSRFAAVNGALLFNADDGVHGEELWTTDGTKAGTRIFADINSGFRTSSPGDRIVYHDKMLFSADDGVNGSELWITDGTPAGTHFLKDLVPGSGTSSPRAFVIFNDLVYFGANNGLWKSDGTADGTVQVKASLSVFQITVAGSWMFLLGSDTSGTEPWASDGTTAGTHLLKDLTPGPGGTMYLNSAVAFRGGVLFVGYDPDHGQELWFSDGTSAGTRMVLDIDGSPRDSLFGGPFGIIGDKAYFSAASPQTGRELWETDGSAAGTRVFDIVPGPGDSFPAGLVTVGSRVFFLAQNPDPALWVTDGTFAGTHRVGPAGMNVANLSPALTNVDGVLYFAGENSLNGFEPWKSDGTDAGTFMIANLSDDSAPSSLPANLTPAGDWLYFDAWDGSGSIANAGTPRALFRTDGTAAGTVKLVERPGTPYIAVGHTLLFNRDLQGPWISDGTVAGTIPATELVSRFPRSPSFLFALGDTLLVSVGDFTSTYELWATKVSAGSPAVRLATVQVTGTFVPMANRAMFFGRADSRSNPGLWITDGTPAGTHAIVSDLGQDQPGIAAVMGGYLYFATFSNGGKLWRSEGTFEGTTVVKAVSAPITNLTPTRTALFFVVGSSGALWVSDGTDSGTRSLSVNVVLPPVAIGDRVVFTSVDQSLWVSDGTVAGTHALLNNLGAAVGPLSELTPAGGVAYFAASDPQHGTELWTTDGTEAGTKMVADIEPLTPSSYPRLLVPAGEHLFFTAITRDTGGELWALSLPLRLSVGDVFAAEGDGVASATFVVTLSRASAQTVTVKYATSDGSAIAGKDYDAVSGSLTFAPGETTKSITVSIHGNSTPENNRTFLMTLSNATGAAIGKPAGFAVIEDDDGYADLALSSDFSQLGGNSVFMKATNNGPRAATGLKITHTVTPADVAASDCASCPSLPGQLTAGQTATAMEYRWNGQQYFTATLSAYQRDPNLSNNSVGWVRGSSIAMDALYLTPGADANIWCVTSTSPQTIESTNPGVVSVPSTLPANATPTFVAHGVSVGTATIRVTRLGPGPGQTVTVPLTVDVVAPGTKVRWPGGVVAFANNTIFSIDQPNIVSVYRPGTAPYTGEIATGTIVVSEDGQELGRATLSGLVTKLPVYVTQLGQQNLTITYSGDTNFLPATTTGGVWSEKGNATIAATAETNGSSVTLHLRLNGSPRFTPTGTVSVSDTGTPVIAQASLSDGRADITLNSLAGGRHAFRISYTGDSIYLQGSQTFPVTIGRHRAAGH